MRTLLPSLFAIALGLISAPQAQPLTGAPADRRLSLSVTAQFCSSTIDRVDQLVRQKFWKEASVAEWRKALTELRPKIVKSADLIELGRNINEALKSLNASHTQFVTVNDETYYFLDSMFCRRKGKPKTVPYSFTGAITGGVDCKANQIRYVLHSSPAAIAGLKPGDRIVSVDGKPYVGQASFFNTAGRSIAVRLDRPGEGVRSVQVKPIIANDYDQYLKATEDSVSVTKHNGRRIGYIHVWCGGQREHDIIEEALGDKLQKSDALIFDIRDGYGGNFYNDLDYFYRPPAGYPDFNFVSRDKRDFDSFTSMFYDKPVVCLINGGSRSGKELVAYSLKKTGRARLVGTRTAGFVLGGSLFDINPRCSIYLAVSGPQPGALDLEHVGVEPDIQVPEACDERGQNDKPFAEAVKLLTTSP